MLVLATCMWYIVAMISTMVLLKFIIYFWFIPNLYSNNGKKTKSLYLAYITPYVIATQLIYTYKFKYCTVKNYIAQTYVGKLFGDRDF